MKKIITLIFLLSIINLKATTHTVTTSADDGDGTLRKIIADAKAGDSIIFASNVDKIILTTEPITINKNLTIIGNSETKTSISGNNESKVFVVLNMQNSVSFNVENLIIENGKAVATSGGIDVYNYCTLIAKKCLFRNNEGYSGGAVFVFGNAFFTAINCYFNYNKTIGAGGSICVAERGSFTAINCAFIKNSIYAVSIGGNYYNANSNFIAINCAFVENKSEYYGAISIVGEGTIAIITNCTFNMNKAGIGGGAISMPYYKGQSLYLHHNTLDKNEAKTGGAIYADGTSKLYTYNSIFTGNTENGVVTAEGQIRGTISGDGKNLIEGINGVTREKVFGENEYKDGIIMPLEYAKSTNRLTKIDIEIPEGMEADTLLSWLETDIRGYKRPDTGFVTYGAVEYDSTYGIREDGSFDVLVLPNPTDRDFNIIFDNPQEQKITIDLVDIEGKNILNIFDGIANSGWQIYRVNEELASSVYFVKIDFNSKLMVRKVVIQK